MTTMEQLNEIWKTHTDRDLSPDEAWKMVEAVRMILEIADRNLDEAKKGE